MASDGSFLSSLEEGVLGAVQPSDNHRTVMAGGTDKQPLGAGLGMVINLSNCSGNLVGSSEVEGSQGLCNL